MAQKFLNLEEAAQMLGISKEKLSQWREDGQIYAYRDGAGWKFKQEEVERVAVEAREGRLGEEEDDALDLDLMGEETDSILLSELELGGSGASSPSTIIGKQDADALAADIERARNEKPDSDLKLAGKSELALEEEPQTPPAGSDILAGEKPKSGPDDTKGSGIAKGSDVANFDELDELEFDLESASDKDLPDAQPTGDPNEQSGVALDEGELTLDTGTSDLSLGQSGLLLGGDANDDDDLAMSDVALAPDDSSIDLAADQDDEMVLGEGSGSDITLGASDSGIGLSGPSDSGLSLDEAPLELGGSAVEAFDMGEGGDSDILLEEEGDAEAATQLKTDEDFLLTPLDESAGEADDSSQVIALDSESFDESADTLLGGSAVVGEGFGIEAAQGGFAPGAAAPAAMTSPAEATAPYSIWNVLSLTLCVLLLTLTGMMLFDLIRNMWSWDETYALNSSLMDGLIQAIPIFK